MNQSKERNSVIERILKQNFARAPLSKDFDKFVSNEQLKLIVTERIDKNLAYVTDGVHTILTIMANKTDMLRYYPLTRQQNMNYTYEPKSYTYLTFNTITDPPIDGLHPYTPHYYLRERYNDFVEFRRTFQIKHPAQRLIIFEWHLSLVNINSVGYYAPVIAIKKYKKQAANAPELPIYQDLNCILYEKWLQQKMESYRIHDIRQLKKEHFPVTKNVSLFYFMRNMKKANPMERNSSMVSMDYEQRIIKHSPDFRKHFILIGNLKGTISFANPQKNEINEAKMEEMNLQNIAMLFNGIKIREEEIKQKVEKQKVTLWSDSSSDEQSEERRDRVMEEEPNDSESDEGEDPLKNLYVKSLQSRRNKAV